MSKKILVIDEGTTSTRAMLFAVDGHCEGSAQRPITQHYPAPGQVEQDASEIWEKTLLCAQEVVALAGGAEQICGLGITNQRETVVFWDKRTGEPLAPAIVWQDRRTVENCDQLKARGLEADVQEKTGLLLDPYFSASKIAWALKNNALLKAAGAHLAVGTIESYLIFRLTGGLHISDATNASRTALMGLETGRWDAGLCALFDVPMPLLPEIVDCTGTFATTDPVLFGGPIPITGMAGDQQAAAIGQACFAPGQTKATFGTGAFILTAAGEERPHSKHRLLATLACQRDGKRRYALEGSIFVAGSLMQWMSDTLGLMESAKDSEALARNVHGTGGVYVVPALSGLGAPHWQPQASGLIHGLSFATQKAHIVRAGLEAMSYQAHDLMVAFQADGVAWRDLRIDGGMAANDWLAQDLADILGVTVERPHFVETTALGAAMLAATGAGLYTRLEDATIMRKAADGFHPKLPQDARAERLDGWSDALRRTLVPEN